MAEIGDLGIRVCGYLYRGNESGERGSGVGPNCDGERSCTVCNRSCTFVVTYSSSYYHVS